MFTQIDGGLTGVFDGLKILAVRAKLSFDAVVHQITSLDQPAQIAAKIRALVETIALPDALPPIQIGNFRRIDWADEVRSLAKDWRNCLTECLYGINDGAYALYLSESNQIVCLLVRLGRLGWFVAQAKGPNNAPVEAAILREMQAQFSAFGFFPRSHIEPIRIAIFTKDWSPGRAQDQKDYDDISLL